MNITMGLIMSRLITYGYERIREFDEYIPMYHRKGKNITLGKSYVHGFVALNMYCERCSMFCANRIAMSILEYANSEFNFKELKICLINDGHELGFYEFDGDEVVFRATVFGTRPDVKYEKQLLNSIYGTRKDEVEELRKTFEEENDDKTETNGLTDSEPDVSTDDSVSGD